MQIFVEKNTINENGGRAMSQEVKKFLVDNMLLDDDRLIGELEEIGEVQHLKRNSLLYHQNQKPEFLTFLLDGIIRGYILNSNGEDITECFEYKFGAPLVPSLPLDAPSIIYMEALTDSSIIQFPIDNIVELIKTNVEVSRKYNDLLVQSMQKHLQLTKILSRCTVSERYQWFLSEYPELYGKVSDKCIASFLNTSTVQLSRVKKDLGMSKRYIHKVRYGENGK